MSGKAFTLTSTHYCRACGSFDMSKDQPDWLNCHVLRIKPIFVCHACASTYSEHAIENNTPRNMPRTVNAFFLQTNLSNQKLINKQLKPLTGIFGLVLIISTIIGLFQLPDQSRTSNKPEIAGMWSKSSSSARFCGIFHSLTASAKVRMYAERKTSVCPCWYCPTIPARCSIMSSK